MVPAMHDGGAGRPAGGIAILDRDSIRIIEDQSCSMNNRVNALVVEISGKKIVVFNVYLSCLINSGEYDAGIEMCYQYIYNTLMNIRVQYDGYINACDFNCNISQIVSSMKTNHICKLMVDLEMISAIRLHNGPMRNTYVCEANDRFSLLDDI